MGFYCQNINYQLNRFFPIPSPDGCIQGLVFFRGNKFVKRNDIKSDSPAPEIVHPFFENLIELLAVFYFGDSELVCKVNSNRTSFFISHFLFAHDLSFLSGAA